MKELILNTVKELKTLVNNQRENILQINQLCLGQIYPMLEISNKHATYYDINEQGYKHIAPPFNVLVKQPNDVFHYIIAIYFKGGVEYYDSSNVNGNYIAKHIESAEPFETYEEAYTIIHNKLELLAVKKGWNVNLDIELIVELK